MDKHEISQCLRMVADAMEGAAETQALKDLLHEKMAWNGEYERAIAELLYGFITLNEMNLKQRLERAGEVPPPNGFPAKKHLDILSKITNPDRVNTRTVEQVKEAYNLIFGRTLVLGSGSHDGVPDDLRIIKGDIIDRDTKVDA